MSKKFVLAATGVILTVAIIGVFFAKDTQAPTKSSSEISSPATTNPSAATTASAGTYLDYSEAVLANTSGTRILFFHAPWCPQCRALDTSIKNGTIPDGVTIFKIDYDSSTKLKQKYGVTLQTTLVKIDDNGELVKKYVAYSSPTLDALKSNLLE